MGKPPTETDLLLEFESRRLRGDYKEYVKARRNNYFATIQTFPRIWECFLILDECWMRDFEDLQRLRDTKQMFPLILFMNAHAKIRIAFELAISCCLGEGWDILRSAIESYAHGHKLTREPHLQKVWIEKDDGKEQAEAFKDAFERNKKANLFPSRHGLDRLHVYWSQFSEWGTHTTVGSMGHKFQSKENESDVQWKLIYTGADPVLTATSLTLMLYASRLMEDGFFHCHQDRLQFDLSLSGMRRRFEREMQKLRQDIIRRFKLKPPSIWP